MSNNVMERLWWRKDLTSTEKIVAISLADQANDDGFCWPAVGTIALRCSLSERTVQNAVKSLCAKVLLRKIERANRSSYFVFNLDNMPLVERTRRAKERGPAEVFEQAGDLFGTGESDDMTGAARATTGESDDMTGAGAAPRTIIEPSGEPSDSSRAYARKVGEMFVERWKTLSATYPKIAGIEKTMSERRLSKLMERLRERVPGFVKGQNLVGAGNFLDELFAKIAGSPFLCGEVKDWAIAPEWVLGPENFTKTMERKNERLDHDRNPTGSGNSAVAAGNRFAELAHASRARASGGSHRARAGDFDVQAAGDPSRDVRSSGALLDRRDQGPVDENLGLAGYADERGGED